MITDVIVIGGGASGLIAAIVAARAGRSVTILEHKDKIGKKILATGNGKCNYTNLHQDPSFYRGDDPSFAMKTLEGYGVEETISFFKELGIYPKEKNGYLYPYSEQASAILDVLQLELEYRKVNIICNEHIKSIHVIKDIKKTNKMNSISIEESHNSFFRISAKSVTYDAHRVILATGGTASSELGSDGSGYLIAKALGHTIIPAVPALVQLKSSEPFFKNLAGIRVQSKIKLYIDNILTEESQGELQLTNYGVSGIPIFEISRYAARALEKKRKVHVALDFLPSVEPEGVSLLIVSRIETGGYKSVEELFIGLLNKKLTYVIIKEAGINRNKVSSKLEKREINELVNQIKNFKVTIQETNSFANAQVSAGGVNTKEVDPSTLESKVVNGLYIVGELLDIDGTCGGYNLQWAWSTGYLAGKAASKNK